MKHFKLVVLLILVTSTQLTAQSYFPYALSSPSVYVLGLPQELIDNHYSLNVSQIITTQHHKKYVFAQHILPSFRANCHANGQNSILGSEVLVYGDSLIAFYNFLYRPINIYLNTLVGQSWTAYEDSVMDVNFTHDSTVLRIINGQTDTVQTFIMNVYDKVNDQHINEFLFFEIGAKTGLISFPCFYTFPYQYANNTALKTPNKFSLSTPNIHNITWDSIYHLEPGDEIHSLTINNTSSLTSPNQFVNDSTKKIIEILQKFQPNPDSLCFLTHQLVFRNIDSNGVKSAIYSNDTAYLGFKRNSVLDAEPSIYTSNPNSTYTVYQTGNFLCKYTRFKNQLIGTDSCFSIVADGRNLQEVYFNGIGGPYYNVEIDDGPYVVKQAHLLQYAKKGAKTWGIPFSKTVGIDVIQQQPIAQVYPNPVNDILTLSQPKTTETQFTLIDVLGKIHLMHLFNSSQTQISVSHIPSGIYYYTISNVWGSYNGKIIIK